MTQRVPTCRFRPARLLVLVSCLIHIEVECYVTSRQLLEQRRREADSLVLRTHEPYKGTASTLQRLPSLRGGAY